MCTIKDYYGNPNGVMLQLVWLRGCDKGWNADRIHKVQRFLIQRRETNAAS